MAEYIEKEAVEKFIENGLNNQNKDKAFGHDAVEIMAEVHYMPAADVAPVRHGRWLDGAENFTCGNHNAECSVCHCNISFNGCDEDFNFCPNCGAKMDLEG